MLDHIHLEELVVQLFVQDYEVIPEVVDPLARRFLATCGTLMIGCSTLIGT